MVALLTVTKEDEVRFLCPGPNFCPFVYLAGRLTLNQESAVRILDGHPN